MASEWVSCACVNETLVNRTIIIFTVLKIIHQNNIQNTVLRTKLGAWCPVRFSYSISQNIINQGCKEWCQIKDTIRSGLTVGVPGVDYWLCAAWSLLIIQFHIEILTISIRRHKKDCSGELARDGWWYKSGQIHAYFALWILNTPLWVTDKFQR